MADLNNLSDRELRSKLAQYGMADIPITSTTRDLVLRRLKTAMESTGNGSSHEHEEAATESRSSSARRRSAGVTTKPKTRQRASLAPTFLKADSRTDESDGNETEPNIKKPQPKQTIPKSDKKTLNGKTELSNSTNSEQMSDEELLRQLAKHNIAAPVITHSTRPILIKKLNHANAKQKRESKSFTTPLSKCNQDDDQDSTQESDKDCLDNSSFISAKERCSVTPSLSFSQQHSLTFGSNTSYLSNESLLKPRLPDYSRTYIPAANPVINRFVEEQEPYDTGSDSENEVPTKKSPKRSWIPSFWFAKKSEPIMNTPVKKSAFYAILKGKLNILWQWQFIAVVLPVLAALFFLLLAAVYIRASYNEAGPPIQGDSFIDLAILNVRTLIERETVSHLCSGNDAVPIESSFLMEQLKVNQSALNKIEEAVRSYPQWGIIVDGNLWSIPSVRLPIWCSIKTYVWNILVAFFVIVVGFGAVVLVHQLVTANCRQREKEEQEVYSMVEMIIDLLARHQSAMVADRRPQEAYLAVTHVRDVLIPLKERKSKQKLWNKAVQFLEDNESRVRPEIQQIEGEDFRVWRWLPPTTTFSPGKPSSPGDQTDDATSPSFGVTTTVTPRPKVWQGQAFSTDSSGVNSPPPYPLTQCLKVRNMFDAEVEVGDSWPVRIQDAILEKADKGKIMHMAVDRGSREGCVYIKCASPDDAGKVYHSLHGWWFDGNLVTVKYLRPERYQYRFPDSAKAVIPLQPSNDKRLSLQTKFWKSPLEHF